MKGQKIVIEEKDQLSCSIGVIEYNSNFIKANCYELLKNADKALYEAKRNGKGCVYSISLQG